MCDIYRKVRFNIVYWSHYVFYCIYYSIFPPDNM